jgi:N6-L-threonylcarbamoyladenine synthase
MRILGIETSCDETAVCLLEAAGDFGPDFKFKILGNALLSQAALHAEYGGVFPSLAKREHAKNLVPLLKEMLAQASNLRQMAQPHPIQGEPLESLGAALSREPELLEQLVPFMETYGRPDIDAIAVTAGPGLEPALWVGINFAKALALAWGLPLVAVNHMEGHVLMSLVDSGVLKQFEFPVLSLLISGGHTELVLSETFGKYKRLGETRDDAAGEAFDKVARLLDLPYPGGPEISRLAAEARVQGLPLYDSKDSPWNGKLTPPMLRSKDYDFSFSGLKTEVRKLVENPPTGGAPLSDDTKKRLALATENAIAEVLVTKTMRAAEEFGARTVVVGGGVAANTYIRQCLTEALAKADTSAQLLSPPAELATDNAVMIALAGYFHAIKKDFADADSLRAQGNLKLESA